MPFGEVGKGGFHRMHAADRACCAIRFGQANTDRVLDFSTAVTGGLFFSPTRLSSTIHRSSPQATPAPGKAGSASIGSLKGKPDADYRDLAPVTGRRRKSN